MNTTLETLHYSRLEPAIWSDLVAEVNDFTGSTPDVDAINMLWDEGRALDVQTFEETRVFALGRLCTEFLRYTIPAQASFTEQCVAKVAPSPLNEHADVLDRPEGLYFSDLLPNNFITAWPSGTAKDESIPIATRLIANTFSVAAPGMEGHVPFEYVSRILSEEPAREAAQVSILGGALLMMRLALAKKYEVKTGKLPDADTPIAAIADPATMQAFDFYNAACRQTNRHVRDLRVEMLSPHAKLVDNVLSVGGIPKQRAAPPTENDLSHAIRTKPVGCPGINIGGAIRFVCDVTKDVVATAQTRLLAAAN